MINIIFYYTYQSYLSCSNEASRSQLRGIFDPYVILYFMPAKGVSSWDLQ